REELARDGALIDAIESAVTEAPAAPHALPEVVGDAGRGDFMHGFLGQLARIAVHARLRARLEDALGDAKPDVAAFHAAFRAAYRDLFLDSLVVVPDPAARGDDIIDRCASVCPPGTAITLMGIQNIKGTGL